MDMCWGEMTFMSCERHCISRLKVNGRPNRTWKKQVEDESVKVGLRMEDALC